MEEIWKDVIGYEGFYQVSNQGNVKSLERFRGNGNGGYIKKEQILKSQINGRGYCQVNLCKNCVGKIFRIHQLVAIYFLGHNIDGHNIVVDHRDGNKLNNQVENLQLVTNRENSSTCYRKNQVNYSSQYVGVCWEKNINKWKSNIYYNGKLKHLGYFDSEIDASNAYQNKLKEI